MLEEIAAKYFENTNRPLEKQTDEELIDISLQYHIAVLKSMAKAIGSSVLGLAALFPALYLTSKYPIHSVDVSAAIYMGSTVVASFGGFTFNVGRTVHNGFVKPYFAMEVLRERGHLPNPNTGYLLPS